MTEYCCRKDHFYGDGKPVVWVATPALLERPDVHRCDFNGNPLGRAEASPAEASVLGSSVGASPPPLNRLEAIQTAIAALDRADFNASNGKPNLEVLRAKSGMPDITTTERDAAWVAM